MFSGGVTTRASSPRSSSGWRSAATRRVDCSARIRVHDTDAPDASPSGDAFWTGGPDRAERLGRQLGKLAEQVDRPVDGLGAVDGDRPPDGATLGHRRGRDGAGRRIRPVKQVTRPPTALKVIDG